ncbi:MAG: AAA family ATPase, partial [Pirellulales bacterium]|nr:AAA family ATPase [Pirellulales bacterium]
GKGGSGKTALVGLLTKHILKNEKKRLLLIDADPTMNLSMVLGIQPEKTVNDIRERIISEARAAGKTEKENLARSLDYMLFEALIEADRFSFLVMGRPESLGCYCPVNDFLRGGIETLAKNYDVIIIDGEAGVEQISRQVMKSVDTPIIVSDISNRGLKTATIIKDVIESHAKIFNYKKMGLVLNRVRGQENELKQYIEKTGLDLFGYIPEDLNVTRFDLKAQPLLELPDDSPAFQAISRIWAKITAA